MGREQQLELAEHFIDLRQPQKALEYLNRVAEEDLETALHWRLRTQAYYQLNRKKEALTCANNGLALAPENLTLLLLFGMLQEDAGDVAAAERTFLKGLGLEPDSLLLLKRYALLLVDAGHLVKAQKVLDRAVQIAPDDPTVIQGQIRLAKARGDRAVKQHSETLLQSDPENAVARTMLGAALANKGKFKAASEQLSAVARDNPNMHDIAAVARDYRDQQHPLLAPLWIFRRFGVWRVWLLTILFVLSATALNLPFIAVPLFLLYITLVIYSWTAPPLLHLYWRWRR